MCRSQYSEHDKKPYKEFLLYRCRARNYECASQVTLRLEGSLDLIAAEARYHRDCMCKFIGLRNIQLTGRESGTDVTDSGLEAVFSFMLENKDILCNSAEVYDIYISCCSSILSFPIVIEKVKERCPLSVLKIRKDGSEDDELEHSKIKVARCIKRECKEIKCKRTHYDIHINKDKMDDAVSQTLSSMLSLVSPKLNKTLSAAIIGNIVTSEVTNEATDLQIALGLLTRDSKKLWTSCMATCDMQLSGGGKI